MLYSTCLTVFLRCSLSQSFSRSASHSVSQYRVSHRLSSSLVFGPLPVPSLSSDEAMVFTVKLRSREQRWTLGTLRVMWTVKSANIGATQHHSALHSSSNQGLTSGNSSFHHHHCPWFVFFSFQITVRIIILSPLGKKQTGKTKKAAAGRASSYLSISSCLCLPPPHLSFSFLSASPLLWGNHVDLYEIWSVSAENKRTAHSVSCPPSRSALCCNPPSCSPSPIFIFSFLSASLTSHHSLQHSSSISISRIHFWWLSSGFSFIHGSNSWLSLLDVWVCACVRVCVCPWVFNGMMHDKGHKPGPEPTVLRERSGCQQDAWGPWFHEEQRPAARNRTF